MAVLRKAFGILFALTLTAHAQSGPNGGIAGPTTGTTVTPIGTFTAGYVILGGGGTSIQDIQTAGSGAVIYRGSGGVNYGVGSVSSPANAFIWQSSPSGADVPGSNPATGVCTDTNTCTTGLFVVGRDTVDASAASNGFYAYMFVDNFGNTGAKGAHHTLLSQFNYVGIPSDLSGSVYSAGNFWATATAAAVTGAGFFGGNFKVNLNNGATGWGQAVGLEIDANIAASGASADQLIGMQIVQQVVGGALGGTYNAALSFNVVNGATGWPIMIDGGGYSGYPAVGTTGKIFTCTPHTGSGNCGTIGAGFDLTSYATITGNAFASPSFSVSGAGSLTAASVVLPSVTTGTPTASLCIDAGNNVIKKTTSGACI